MAKILGVRVDDVRESEALERVQGLLLDGKQHTIFTPNPEMLVAAHRDQAFRDVLNTGSLNMCDGRGLQLFGKVRNRLSGVDFMQSLCAFAQEENRSVYFLGGHQNVAKKTANVLKKKFPNLYVAGYSAGPVFSSTDAGVHFQEVERINASHADILFVAFGHEKQEMWINAHLSELPSVKIAMGVGGSFDFISGNTTRAPKWIRSLGLEWLFRLIQQPRRIKRIFTAVIVFPLLILKSKI